MHKLTILAAALLVGGEAGVQAQTFNVSKVSGLLWELIDAVPAPVYGPVVMTASGPQQAVVQRAQVPTADGYVLITAIAEGDAATLAAQLSALDAEETAVAGRVVSARLPVSSITGLAGLSGLRFARPALAMANAGLTTSQGCRALGSDVAQALYHVTGAGVRVGILSDSFDAKGQMAAGILSGDLPADILILADVTGTTDEGRAMGEIVHDVAPGAALAFHTAWQGEAGFANGIRALRDAGCRVIVDDVIYLEEPMFADGIIAQAVDEVAADGVAYFSSAGNASRHSYEAPFRNGGSGYHDFDPGAGVNTILNINLLLGTTFFVFQWPDRYASTAPGNAGAQTDLDIELVYRDGRSMGGMGSFNLNLGSDPTEVFGVTTSGWLLEAGLRIRLKSGNPPPLVKLLWYAERGLGQEQYHTYSSTLYAHMNARGAMAVGAARYCNTPAFGQSPPLIEYFSSAGGTPIFYTPEGSPMYELRERPSFVAPQGGNNTFFGGSDYCNVVDAYPNFYGTSAAAPHAAGVAALMLEARPKTTPERTREVLQATAIEMEEAGFDFTSGYGLIQADAALAYLTQSAPVLESVVSRQTHGTRGAFDIPLPLSGPAGTESRLGGPRTLVFTFDAPIQRATPKIIAGTGTVTGSTITDNRVTVQLSGVANLQWLTVGLEAIQGVGGGYLNGASVVVGCIEGDVNQDRITSTLDVGLVRLLAGAYADTVSFRRDLNADGVISTLDVGLVGLRAGNVLR
jgi:subtilisin family serine protease